MKKLFSYIFLVFCLFFFSSINVVAEEKKKSKWITKKESTQTQQTSNNTEEQSKLAEEKKKLEEEKARIIEATKQLQEEKKRKTESDNRYKLLVEQFGEECESGWSNFFTKYEPGTVEYKQCLIKMAEQEMLKAKIEADKLKTSEEILAGLGPEEKRAYKCEKIFNFKKNSDQYKDCVFKLYQADLDREKIDIEKEKLELQKKLAEQQTRQKLIDAQATKDALLLEKKKLAVEKRKLEVTKAQSKAALELEQKKLEAALAQADAAEKQAMASAMQAEELRKRNKIERGRDSDKMIRRGLKMMSNDPSAAGCTLGTLFNC